MNAGFFVLPRHEPTLVLETIRRARPSLVKFWVSSTSAQQVQAWREASPSTIFLAVDGDIGDSNEKNTLDFDLAKRASEHCDAWARWRDKGFGSLYMTYNEPPAWNGREYRKRLVEYTVHALERAHARGLSLCIFNFSVSWPLAVLDVENWWPEFAPAIQAMRTGDYLGLHEYWPKQGPLDLRVYPWMAGKHRLCPYNVPILISECGLDQATIEGPPNRGWRLYLNAEQYAAQLADYHSTLDPRVKGTAIFLFDYEDNRWESFDIRTIAHIFPLAIVPQSKYQKPASIAMPVQNARVSQWFGENLGYYRQFGINGHNGIDFACPIGTQVVACDDGIVYKLSATKDGYGNAIWINHGWGMSIYAHLSQFKAADQQFVRRGQVVGLSGNTGNSTGPHLHFGIRIYGEHDAAMNDWRDPAPLLGLVPTVTQTPMQVEGPSMDIQERIRHAVWNAIGERRIIAYNPDAAFAKFARQRNLGAPLTNEIDVDGHRCQGYASAIVYARIGDWGNVKILQY